MPVHRVTVGVAAQCDVQVVGDPWVSGFHAALTRDEGGRFWVEDMGSTNGTWIQRAGIPRPAHPALLPRVWAPTQVRVGDTIWLSRQTAITLDGAGKLVVGQ